MESYPSLSKYLEDMHWIVFPIYFLKNMGGV